MLSSIISKYLQSDSPIMPCFTIKKSDVKKGTENSPILIDSSSEDGEGEIKCQPNSVTTRNSNLNSHDLIKYFQDADSDLESIPSCIMSDYESGTDSRDYMDSNPLTSDLAVTPEKPDVFHDSLNKISKKKRYLNTESCQPKRMTLQSNKEITDTASNCDSDSHSIVNADCNETKFSQTSSRLSIKTFPLTNDSNGDSSKTSTVLQNANFNELSEIQHTDTKKCQQKKRKRRRKRDYFWTCNKKQKAYTTCKRQTFSDQLKNDRFAQSDQITEYAEPGNNIYDSLNHTIKKKQRGRPRKALSTLNTEQRINFDITHSNKMQEVDDFLLKTTNEKNSLEDKESTRKECQESNANHTFKRSFTNSLDVCHGSVERTDVDAEICSYKTEEKENRNQILMCSMKNKDNYQTLCGKKQKIELFENHLTENSKKNQEEKCEISEVEKSKDNETSNDQGSPSCAKVDPTTNDLNVTESPEVLHNGSFSNLSVEKRNLDASGIKRKRRKKKSWKTLKKQTFEKSDLKEVENDQNKNVGTPLNSSEFFISTSFRSCTKPTNLNVDENQVTKMGSKEKDVNSTQKIRLTDDNNQTLVDDQCNKTSADNNDSEQAKKHFSEIESRKSDVNSIHMHSSSELLENIGNHDIQHSVHVAQDKLSESDSQLNNDLNCNILEAPKDSNKTCHHLHPPSKKASISNVVSRLHSLWHISEDNEIGSSLEQSKGSGSKSDPLHSISSENSLRESCTKPANIYNSKNDSTDVIVRKFLLDLLLNQPKCIKPNSAPCSEIALLHKVGKVFLEVFDNYKMNSSESEKSENCKCIRHTPSLFNAVTKLLKLSMQETTSATISTKQCDQKLDFSQLFQNNHLMNIDALFKHCHPACKNEIEPSFTCFCETLFSQDSNNQYHIKEIQKCCRKTGQHLSSLGSVNIVQNTELAVQSPSSDSKLLDTNTTESALCQLRNQKHNSQTQALIQPTLKNMFGRFNTVSPFLPNVMAVCTPTVPSWTSVSSKTLGAPISTNYLSLNTEIVPSNSTDINTSLPQFFRFYQIQPEGTNTLLRVLEENTNKKNSSAHQFHP